MDYPSTTTGKNIERIEVPLNNGTKIIVEYEPDCIFNKDINIYIENQQGRTEIAKVYPDYALDNKAYIFIAETVIKNMTVPFPDKSTFVIDTNTISSKK